MDAKFKSPIPGTGPPEIGPLLKSAWLEAKHMSNVVNGAKNLMNALKKGGPPDLINDVKKQLKDLLNTNVPKPKGGLGLEIPNLEALKDLVPEDELPTESVPTPTSAPFTTLPTSGGRTSLQASTALQSTLSTSLASTQQSATASTTTSSSSSSSSSSHTPTAAAQDYFIMTKFGTDYDTFLNFTTDLDNNSGDISERSEFPEVEWPFYYTYMNETKAKELMDSTKYPFIEGVFVNDPGTGDGEIDMKGVIPLGDKAGHLRVERAAEEGNYPPNPDLIERRWEPSRVTSPINHLSMISQALPGNIPNSYIFDPSLGRGSTIYVVDSGFTPTLVTGGEFDMSRIQQYVVPNKFSLRGISTSLHAPEDMTDRYKSQDAVGHGTFVGSIAAGLMSGVASNADLFFIKVFNQMKNPNYKPPIPGEEPVPEFGGAGGLRMGAVIDSFRIIMNDVRKRDLKGKAVVNLSIGIREGSKHFRGISSIMKEFIQRCDDLGIAIVVAAGNSGNPNLNAGQKLVPLHKDAMTMHGTDDNAVRSLESIPQPTGYLGTKSCRLANYSRWN
ncbi:subtilisin-like protein [Mytilinidion resinicola]|uniref:Subtilisin-like protein n=1 Tax=Mytilinidion resinicola TaxID=574789 RepID=A0A6A6YAU3_9PEZI|nr:subtilisin-like protein [Mytilinidion resinicola]KAF2804957.1 subtilisin-like protein [Mytilinidion resinicola]